MAQRWAIFETREAYRAYALDNEIPPGHAITIVGEDGRVAVGVSAATGLLDGLPEASAADLQPFQLTGDPIAALARRPKL